MNYPRIVVCLLVDGMDLVKTRQFRDPQYIGDPLNAIRIFNAKEVDELVLLDITASQKGTGPSMSLLRQVTAECFMPLTYGGGITSVDQIAEILKLGVEKVSLNATSLRHPEVIREAVNRFGSQSIVASIDVKARLWGRYEVVSDRGRRGTGTDPVARVKELEALGVGEIVVQSVDQEGTGKGYDLKLAASLSQAVNIPVVFGGGAAALSDMVSLIGTTHVSAAMAGRLFVYYGNRQGILINWPGRPAIVAAYREANAEYKQAG